MDGNTHIEINESFQRALELLDSGASLFITGKAGTGKSTLLRYFLDRTERRAVVTAPTGVAALNVGGMTIHRLLSFPPTVSPEFVESREYFPRRNAAILKSLETLVVDEASMVRADLLDAMDAALRRFGPQPGQPFGGVQMVFVGDPYQLPPVVTEHEDRYFRSRYPTPYFFSADAFRTLNYDVVELDKVYRQRDDEFVALLNAVRVGDAVQADFDRLNERYLPDFEPDDDQFWITLTTTNTMAEDVNNRHLAHLDSSLITALADMWGDVTEQDKPTSEVLEFKVGAQVMLLTNDPADRWVNGSMGVITDVDDVHDQLRVGVDLLDGNHVTVTPATWEITRPVLDGRRLTHEVVGSYTQLPLRLAWAVTIHKSQGKTLDRVVVSLGRGTVADGQLYVALSRCTSLQGLVLKSLIKPHHVKVEREVNRFLARRTGSTVEADGHAYLGLVATGMGRLDKITEVGFTIDRGGELESFSTLINPMRDIGTAADDYGITPDDLSMAPTLAEAWPWIARRIDGCVLIGEGLPLLQTMLERELQSQGLHVSLGLGINTRELGTDRWHDPDDGPDYYPDALRAAQAAREELRSHLDATVVTAPYRAGEEATGHGRILSRRANTSEANQPCSGQPLTSYSDAVAGVLGGQFDETAAIAHLERSAEQLGVDNHQRDLIHRTQLEALVTAVTRDGVVSESERSHIHYAAHVLDLPVPDLPDGNDHDISQVLVPGARVCFTGSAHDLSGRTVERHELEALASERGLICVDSVTKKKCEALIAEDAASMSGKAKKARGFGKPVLSVHDFLTWAELSLRSG